MMNHIIKLFFTTNNNQLYRDVWMYDLNTDKEKLLFIERCKNWTINYFTNNP